MPSKQTTANYDPNVIIQSANEKLALGDFGGGQMVFQSALLTWVDDARELQQDNMADEQIQQAIATLWLSYADYLITAKQFKSATEAYEQAIACPIASHVGRVYLEYARFAEGRGKLKTAQSVYLKALVGEQASGNEHSGGGVQDEQDRALLWNEFLEMTRKTSNNPSLTLADLQKAVQHEQSIPAAVASASPDDPDQPAKKRLKVDTSTSSSPVPFGADDTTNDNKTHVVTAESVQEEATAFAEVLRQQLTTLPSEVAAAWMVRDGTDPPQPPDPPLFQASPPKLSDPTAKDFLGVPLALALIRRLVGPSGNVILQVCRALWMLQGMKEQETKAALDDMDKLMLKEHERLETNLETRLSAVMGNAAINNPQVERSVKQMNQSERAQFQTACGQQRQQLLSKMAWEFRQLLCLQQQVLIKLAVPGFVEYGDEDDVHLGDNGGPTVDVHALDLQSRVCTFLHSAFYLRNRIGAEPHLKMLKSQETRLAKEMETMTRGASPVPPTGSSSPVSPYMTSATSTPPPAIQQMQLHPQAGQGMQQPQPGYNYPPPPQQGGAMPPYGYQIGQPQVYAQGMSLPPLPPPGAPMMPPYGQQQQPPPPPPPPPPHQQPYGNQQYPYYRQ